MSTVKEQVMAALADGEEISVTHFARQIGSYAMAVTRVLREISPMLQREDKSTGQSQRLVVYRAKDPHSLRAAFLGSGPSFGELLQAWGIAHRDINLPFIQHFRSEES